MLIESNYKRPGVCLWLEVLGWLIAVVGLLVIAFGILSIATGADQEGQTGLSSLLFTSITGYILGSGIGLLVSGLLLIAAENGLELLAKVQWQGEITNKLLTQAAKSGPSSSSEQSGS